jgi:hypothetical protein
MTQSYAHRPAITRLLRNIYRFYQQRAGKSAALACAGSAKSSTDVAHSAQLAEVVAVLKK